MFTRCISYVYIINNLFRKYEAEKYDVSGLFED